MLFRKAILLIHGFAGGEYDYGQLGNELEYFLDFDVYSFTLPGHEKTIIRKVSYNDWIKAAEMQVDRLIDHGYRNIYVVGHSMGGVIASHIASKYNKYVKRLVLAAPAFKYMYFKKDKIDIIKTIKNTPDIFNGISTEVVLSRVFKTPLSTALEFTKLVKEYQNTPKKVNCPTLIIHGLDDKIVPFESCRYVYDEINSKHKILYNILDVNHDCFTGKREDEVNKIVIIFFRKKIIIAEKSIIEI